MSGGEHSEQRELVRRHLAMSAVGLLTAGVLVGSASAASAATLVVDDDFGGVACAGAGYATIQAALTAAADGDVVEVCAGTYAEDLSITDANLTLRSQSGTAADVVIEGIATQSQASFPDTTMSTNVTVDASGVTIQDLTFRSPDAVAGDRSSGMVVDGTGITISGNVFEIRQQGVTGSNGGNTSVAIQTVSAAVDAASDVDGLTISDNSFSGAPAQGYYGVYVNPQGAAVDELVTVSGNSFSGTIWRAVTTERSSTTVSGNTFSTTNDPTDFTSATGVMVTSFAEATVSDVTVQTNEFTAGGGAFAEAIRIGFPTIDPQFTALTVTKNQVAAAAADESVHVYSSAEGATVTRNALLSPLDNGDDGLLDATCNWWGAADGPAPDGSGATVTGNVDTDPFLTTSDLTAACPPPTGGGGGTPADGGTVSTTTEDGGTATTDTAGDGAGPGEAELTITTPVGGAVDVVITYETDLALGGFAVLDLAIDITAPDATAADPIELAFEIDSALLPAGENASTIALLRDGVPVPACTATEGSATPDPCVAERTTQDDGDAVLRVLTSSASTWSAAEVVDACPDLLVDDAGYADVGDGNVHADAIDCLDLWGIVEGLDEDTFGPSAGVTRGQLASILARAMDDAGAVLPAQPGSGFSDVPADGVHADAIRQLADLDVIEGFSDGTFRPSVTVSRGQVAALVVRAYEELTGETLSSGGDTFTDDDGGVFETAIETAADAGFVIGTTTTTYEPTRDVRRDEVATIVARVLEPLVDLDLASTPVA